jgi:Radical SAM superfamily
MDLPRFLQVEPVGQCSLRCQMCPIQFPRDGPPYGPPAFMDFDAFTRLLDQFPDLEELQLQGLGEPMMPPRFFDMVAYAASRRIKVGTNSNLTLLNAKRAELCVTSGLVELHASIDGAAAETYEEIRVRSHFDRITRNIEGLVEARRRLGSATPWLQMVAVVMRCDLHELADLVRLAHRLEIDAVFVQHPCHDFSESSLPVHYAPMRDFVDLQALLGEDPARIDQHFDEARAVAEELGVDLRLPLNRPRSYPPARLARSGATGRGGGVRQLPGTGDILLLGRDDRPDTSGLHGRAGRRRGLERPGS